MTNDNPPDYELKLFRAHQHLKELDREAVSWIKHHLKTAVAERDPDDSDYFIIKVTADSPPNYPFGVLIGDCVHNMRCSLDHLAFALASAHTRPLPDTIAEQSEFPIFGDESRKGVLGSGPALFRDNGLRKIAGIDPAAQKVIDGLQPYHRGKDFRAHPLWLLHDLANIDKHRLVHTSAAAVRGLLLRVSDEPDPEKIWTESFWLARPERLTVFSPRAQGETVVARIKATPGTETPAGDHFENKVQFHVPLKIVFEDIGIPTVATEWVDVSGQLKSVYEFIRTEVFPPLAPFLK